MMMIINAVFIQNVIVQKKHQLKFGYFQTGTLLTTESTGEVD